MKQYAFLLYNIICIAVCLTLHTACDKTPSDQTAESLYNIGKQWRKQQQLDSAIRYLTRAEETITPTTDPTLQAKIYANIADMMSINKNYTQAVDYFRRALNRYRQAGDRNMEAYTLMDIGVCHQNAKDTIEIALSYYARALALSPNDTIAGDIVRQIGQCYYFYNRHDSARHYLHKSLSYPYRASDQSVALLFLGMSYYDTQQPDSAEHYLLRALDCQPDFRQRVGCYTMLHQVAEVQGDDNAIARYGTLHAKYSDSIGRVDARLSKELQNIGSARNDELEVQNQWRNYGIVFFVLLSCGAAGACLCALQAYRRHKARAAQEAGRAQLAEEEARQATQKALRETERADRAARRAERMKEKLLAAEQERLQHFERLQQELLQKYELEEIRAVERRRQAYAERLSEALKKARQYPAQSPKSRNRLLAACREVLPWDESEQLTALFDREFNGLARKIKNFYPKRSAPVTTRLCCLVWLEVSPEDIRCLMGYTTDSYRSIFTRAADHFGAKTAEELLTALKALVAQDRDGRR